MCDIKTTHFFSKFFSNAPVFLNALMIDIKTGMFFDCKSLKNNGLGLWMREAPARDQTTA
jgi:hypothetical protein